MRYLLDTNALSEPAKPRPDKGLMARLEKHRAEICRAAPVWHELLFGYRRLPPSKRRDQLGIYLIDHLAPSLSILPYDATAAAWHAAERARLGNLGRTPPFVDGQIAAVAGSCELILVTANLADYREFEGLELEDWTAPS